MSLVDDSKDVGGLQMGGNKIHPSSGAEAPCLIGFRVLRYR